MPKKGNFKNCTIAKPAKTRKAPAEHAKCYQIGTAMVGIDGTMYVIRKPGKGAARWYPAVRKPRAPKAPAAAAAATKTPGLLTDTDYVQVGPRGGQYVIKNGRKEYLKKGKPRAPLPKCRYTRPRGPLMDTRDVQKENGKRFVIRNGYKIYLKKGQKNPRICAEDAAIIVENMKRVNAEAAAAVDALFDAKKPVK